MNAGNAMTMKGRCDIEHMKEFLERVDALTGQELAALSDGRRAASDAYGARDLARDAAWERCKRTGRTAEWRAFQGSPRVVVRDTARALIARDVITAEQYDTLTALWRTVIGRIHPDDAELASNAVLVASVGAVTGNAHAFISADREGASGYKVPAGV